MPIEIGDRVRPATDEARELVGEHARGQVLHIVDRRASNPRLLIVLDSGEFVSGTPMEDWMLAPGPTE